VFPEVPLVPASLGILGRLEDLAVHQYLGNLGNLGNLELLEHPAILGILEHLANLRYLGVPGNLGSLECLGFLERLEYRRQRFPANLGSPECLVYLENLEHPEALQFLEVPAILGIPERPESRLRQ
jgi:hypothetical protein